MNSHHRAIRALLQSMAPRRAIEYIQSFELNEDETEMLIQCDVRKKSRVKLNEAGYSDRVIRDTKYRAYSKIADQLNNA